MEMEVESETDKHVFQLHHNHDGDKDDQRTLTIGSELFLKTFLSDLKKLGSLVKKSTERSDWEFSEALSFILHDFTKFCEAADDLKEIQSLIDTKIFPQFCSFTQSLHQNGFDILQETLVKFLIEDWPRGSCLMTVDFIANLFGFIAKLLSGRALEEYVRVFANPAMPPQINLFVLPAVARSLPAEVGQAEDVESDAHLIRIILSNEKNSNKDEILRTMWTQLNQKPILRLTNTLLPICTCTALILQTLEEEVLILVAETVVHKFLKRSSNDAHLMLGSCALLLGFKQVTFENESTLWDKVSELCREVIKLCIQVNQQLPLQVVEFGIACVCSFLDNVKTESPGMIHALHSFVVSLINTGLEKEQQNNEQNMSKATSDTQQKKLRAEHYVPVIEKITKKIISENIELDEEAKRRLTAAFHELNNYMC